MVDQDEDEVGEMVESGDGGGVDEERSSREEPTRTRTENESERERNAAGRYDSLSQELRERQAWCGALWPMSKRESARKGVASAWPALGAATAAAAAAAAAKAKAKAKAAASVNVVAESASQQHCPLLP